MVRSLSASLHLSDFPIETSLHLLSHVCLTIFRELSSDLVQNTMSQQYEWPRHAMVGPLWLLWHMAPDESSRVDAHEYCKLLCVPCAIFLHHSCRLNAIFMLRFGPSLAFDRISSYRSFWCDAPCHDCCLVIAVSNFIHFVLCTCVSKFNALWASK